MFYISGLTGCLWEFANNFLQVLTRGSNFRPGENWTASPQTSDIHWQGSISTVSDHNIVSNLVEICSFKRHKVVGWGWGRSLLLLGVKYTDSGDWDGEKYAEKNATNFKNAANFQLWPAAKHCRELQKSIQMTNKDLKIRIITMKIWAKLWSSRPHNIIY